MKVSVLWSWHPSIVRDLKGQAGKVAQLVEFFPYKPEDPSALIGTHIKKQGGEHLGSQCCWYGDRRIPGTHWVSQPSLTRVLALEEQDPRLTFSARSLSFSSSYFLIFTLRILDSAFLVSFILLSFCSSWTVHVTYPLPLCTWNPFPITSCVMNNN